MKELLIKIRALFEGNGADQAAKSIEKVSDAADDAKTSTNQMSGMFDDGAAKAGLFAGATAALGGAIIGFAQQAVEMAINAIKNLIAGFIEGISKAAEFAGAMTDLSARTGQPIEQLVVLKRAFENAGMSAEAVGPMLNKLQKALAGVNEDGEPTSDVLNKLGLSVAQLNNMTATQQLEAIAQSISKLPTPAQQAAAAMELFGRGGGQMLAILKDGEAFTTAAQQVGSLGDNTAKAAKSLDTFSDAMAGLDDKKMGFFMAASAQFATDLERAGVAMNQLDLGPLGEDVGQIVRGVIEVSKEIGVWVEVLNKFLALIGMTKRDLYDMMASLDPTGFYKLIGWLHDVGAAAVDTDQKAAAAAKSAMDTSAETSAQTLERIRNEAGLTVDSAGRLVRQGATEVVTVVTASGERMTANVSKAVASGAAAVSSAGTKATESIKLTADQVDQAARQIAQAFQTGMGQSISPALQGLVNAVQANMTGIAAALTTTSQQLAQTLNPTSINGPIDSLKNTLNTFSSNMTTQMTALSTLAANLNTVATTFQQQMVTLQAAVTALSTNLQNANLGTVAADLTQVGTTLGQAFISIGQANASIVQTVNSGTSSMVSTVNSGVQSIASTFSSAASSIASAVSGAIRSVWSAIERLQAQINAVASRIR